MIIEEIRKKIQQCINNNIQPDTLIISKDIERQMFLDDSFPKGDNYEDKIIVDNTEFNLIVLDNNERYIRVLGCNNLTK